MKTTMVFDTDNAAVRWLAHLVECFLIKKVTIKKIVLKGIGVRPERIRWRMTVEYE